MFLWEQRNNTESMDCKIWGLSSKPWGLGFCTPAAPLTADTGTRCPWVGGAAEGTVLPAAGAAPWPCRLVLARALGICRLQAHGCTLICWGCLLIKQFGVPPGRNWVEISAHLDRDPAARERAGNGCNTFNCYQACTVCLCIGLLVLLWRSGRARWSWQWGSRRTVELWRTGRAGPPARRSERMPCGPAARGSGRRPVPQGPPESA